MELQNKLQANLRQYHQMVFEAFRDYLVDGEPHRLYDEEKFLEILNAPRKSFLAVCKEAHLNYSTMAGTILEWTLHHFFRCVRDPVGKGCSCLCGQSSPDCLQMERFTRAGIPSRPKG